MESPPGGHCAPPDDLSGWLRHIESRHVKLVDMGLDRVRIVADRLALHPSFPVITVGGTNGKGSTCALLEAMLDHAGFSVGCYTSPHLLRYNERVRVSRKDVTDASLCEAFSAVEAARGDVPLTYFEFGSLAAVWHFVHRRVDVAVLEVGLGGRLDAVNVFDADCAVVTSVAIDHVDYLGPTREGIAREKAGIFRPGRPAIVADYDVPETMRDHARGIGAAWLQIGRDFDIQAQPPQWRYEGPGGMRSGLPYPALRGDYQLRNAAAAITALDLLRGRLPVSSAAIRSGLLSVVLAGRFQVLPGRPVTIFDVAHNPDAAARLAEALRTMPSARRTHAVFSMLADKDMAGVVDLLRPEVDCWHIAPLEVPRGADVPTIERALGDAGVLDEVRVHASVSDAWKGARELADMDDRILTFGSFYTVAQALECSEARGG
ncbi:MAG: bifunctional tetrahydrofolate synthase/dihydrofolate synthase [Betaproteobacteria bacterium]|nr:bifunctional tetrahydrofolate synthase/dihydrofolate synthase [Betaproteobacteria bacterium]